MNTEIKRTFKGIFGKDPQKYTLHLFNGNFLTASSKNELISKLTESINDCILTSECDDKIITNLKEQVYSLDKIIRNNNIQINKLQDKIAQYNQEGKQMLSREGEKTFYDNKEQVKVPLDYYTILKIDEYLLERINKILSQSNKCTSEKLYLIKSLIDSQKNYRCEK